MTSIKSFVYSPNITIILQLLGSIWRLSVYSVQSIYGESPRQNSSSSCESGRRWEGFSNSKSAFHLLLGEDFKLWRWEKSSKTSLNDCVVKTIDAGHHTRSWSTQESGTILLKNIKRRSRSEIEPGHFDQDAGASTIEWTQSSCKNNSFHVIIIE